MGASSRSSRSLKFALSKTSLDLEFSERSPAETEIQQERKHGDAAKVYWQLLCTQVEIITNQQTVLHAKDDKISDLEDQVMKLKEKIKSLEKKETEQNHSDHPPSNVRTRSADSVSHDSQGPPSPKRPKLSEDKVALVIEDSDPVKKNDNQITSSTSTWESPLILNEEENCLTTKLHYYVLDRNEELMDTKYKSLELLPRGDNSMVVEVPSWREKVVNKRNCASSIENLDDSVFLKRHQKLELDERRRKRWDAQRLREEQYLIKLKSRSSRRNQPKRGKRRNGSTEDGGVEKFYHDVETFQPRLEDITAIRVEDDLPISVYGYPLPLVEPANLKGECLENSRNARRMYYCSITSNNVNSPWIKITFVLPWELKPRRPKRCRNEVYYNNSSLGSRQNFSSIPR